MASNPKLGKAFATIYLAKVLADTYEADGDSVSAGQIRTALAEAGFGEEDL
jgi:hypothetical protein